MPFNLDGWMDGCHGLDGWMDGCMDGLDGVQTAAACSCSNKLKKITTFFFLGLFFDFFCVFCNCGF